MNKKNNSQLINQDSGNFERYTQEFVIEAARKTMGSIDLDPSSCIEANKIVNARHIFTEKDDGLEQPWYANVWMNHPFSRQGNPLWINKLIEEWKKDNVKQATCICFASTSEKWFLPLMRFPQCYLNPRTAYHDETGKLLGKGPKGSVVTYMGDNIEGFYENFKAYGNVMIPLRDVDQKYGDKDV